MNVDVVKSFSFMFYHFYSLDKYFLTLGSHPPRFRWLLKIVERKCLVWERCSSGGSASWPQASPLVRCRSCSEQQDSMSPCATMLPLLGSTSSDCKSTSYFGFLFLRTARPKAFFLTQNVEDSQEFWKIHLQCFGQAQEGIFGHLVLRLRWAHAAGTPQDSSQRDGWGYLGAVEMKPSTTLIHLGCRETLWY